jgi:hypothetical protein
MNRFRKPDINSKYLARFKNLAAHPDKPFKLAGSRLLIESIELGEVTSESGLILSSPTDQSRGSFQQQAAHVGIVLFVGTDDTLEDGTKIEPGNIVLVPEYGLRSYTTFPGIATYTDGDLQLSTVDQIHVLYKDVDAFHKAFEALNE